MKVTAQKQAPPPPKFNPYEVTITVESAAEAGQLFAMFNHGFIRKAVPKVSCLSVLEEMKRAQGEIPDYYAAHDEICNQMRDFAR